MEYCSGENLRNIIDSKKWWEFTIEDRKNYFS